MRIARVRDAAGRVAADDVDATRLVADHWRGALSAQRTDPALQLRLLRFLPERPERNFVWTTEASKAPRRDPIRSMVRTWRTRERCHLGGRTLPWRSAGRSGGGLNASDMVLLPKVKAGVVDDAQAIEVERSAAAIRPLQLSNTDAKLMAHIAIGELRNIAPEVCGDHQRGFMKGRVIWDNVLELDTYMRMYAMVPDHSCGGPALALRRAGTPRGGVLLVRRLYDQNVMCLSGSPGG